MAACRHFMYCERDFHPVLATWTPISCNLSPNSGLERSGSKCCNPQEKEECNDNEN